MGFGAIGFVKNLAPMLIYIAGVCAFLLSLSGHVRYGLFFLVPLLPLQNVFEKLQIFPFGKDFNDILIFGMIVGWIISKVSTRKPILSKSSLNGILVFYFFYTYFTLWMGSHYLGEDAPINPLDERVQLWKNYMVLPLLFFISFNNFRQLKDLKTIFLLMCFSILLMNYYNVQQVSDLTSWFSRMKIHGTFVWLGANEVAAFYSTYTFVLLGVAFYTKERRMKFFLWFLVIVNSYLILFLFSRGAYLATLLGTLLFAILKKRIFMIPMIILLVVGHPFLPKTVMDRLQYSEHEGSLDDSAQTRLVLWQQSIIYIKENPIFGVGFNVFHRLGFLRDTHNVYLRTLAEQGIIGAFYLFLIWGIAFSRALRLYRLANEPFLKGLGLGFACCVVGVAVGNFFGDRWSHLPLSAFFWVFLGMIERGNLLIMEEKEKITVNVKPVKQIRKYEENR